MKTAATEIYGYLKHFGLPDNIARWATAQAAHETGGFTSAIWHENKNAFGMKYVGQTAAIGANRGHAKYSSVYYSVLDYVGWYQRRRVQDPFTLTFTLSMFVGFLKKHNYFEDSVLNYYNGCNYWSKRIFD